MLYFYATFFRCVICLKKRGMTEPGTQSLHSNLCQNKYDQGAHNRVPEVVCTHSALDLLPHIDGECWQIHLTNFIGKESLQPQQNSNRRALGPLDN